MTDGILQIAPMPTHYRFIDLTGKTFERLTVLSLAANKAGLLYWNCHCRCGNIKQILGSHLKSGRVISCGCRLFETKNTTHFGTSKQSSALLRKSYHSWTGAKARCSNPLNQDYSLYGGRGIECRFDSFEAFVSCVGICPSSKHSIDRIDTNGHYEPGNVRWADHFQQARNRRNSVLVELDGEQVSLALACEKTGLPYETVAARLRKGWPVEKALSTRVGETNRRFVICKGREMNLKKACEELGLAYYTIKARMNRNQSFETATTTPIKRAMCRP